jgi:hypothetical protein
MRSVIGPCRPARAHSRRYGVIPCGLAGCLCRTGMFVLRFVWLAGRLLLAVMIPG